MTRTMVTSFRTWLSAWAAMSLKELTIMTRYPVEFVASFGQVFLIIMIMTLAGLMFAPAEISAHRVNQGTGLVMYGFVLYIFLSDTLWTIGYNIRREQKQGTLEQLYLSPASKSASLVSRVTVTLVWVGLLSLASLWLVSTMFGRLPVNNLPLGLVILALSLSGTFGLGFAFAALTLRVRETAQTLANLFQFSFIVLCAPFFPFSALPASVQTISRLIPLSYRVDALRSTLMGYPAGFPELAPLEVELVIITIFGLLMPGLGFWLYRREENRARYIGSLSEY
ncbi:MAG: ABC transporter permease [Chloroflexi bacterium]|nr:ABC transporter permease [Chloroflexota bacterium]